MKSKTRKSYLKKIIFEKRMIVNQERDYLSSENITHNRRCKSEVASIFDVYH